MGPTKAHVVLDPSRSFPSLGSPAHSCCLAWPPGLLSFLLFLPQGWLGVHFTGAVGGRGLLGDGSDLVTSAPVCTWRGEAISS